MEKYAIEDMQEPGRLARTSRRNLALWAEQRNRFRPDVISSPG